MATSPQRDGTLAAHRFARSISQLKRRVARTEGEQQDVQRHVAQWLTVKEVAREAKVSPAFVRAEVRRARLQASRLGRLLRIPRADFERWMRGEAA